jgi:hypothetical protein
MADALHKLAALFDQLRRLFPGQHFARGHECCFSVSGLQVRKNLEYLVALRVAETFEGGVGWLEAFSPDAV